MAQLAEQLICNQQVTGSSPVNGFKPVSYTHLPGGPKIEALAKEGDKDAIAFPRAKVNDSKMDFSFSGLKSSVLNYLNKCEMKGEEVNRADVAASFQEAVVDVLSSHGVEAAKRCV